MADNVKRGNIEKARLTLGEELDVFHEREARHLFEIAMNVARDRFPAAADTLVRRVANALLMSASMLADARCGYPHLTKKEQQHEP